MFTNATLEQESQEHHNQSRKGHQGKRQPAD